MDRWMKTSHDLTDEKLHPFGNLPATPTMKGIPAYSLLVDVTWGVFQFGVLKQA